MWQPVFQSPAAADGLERFVIAAHHPDRLRRPLPPPGGGPGVRFQQALVWNTFRTLELLSPSFWFRRFQCRLIGELDLVPPQLARVHLWQTLPLPPIQRIDGATVDPVIDVLLETEHAVWTLTLDSTMLAARDRESEAAAAIVDAGDWFAGGRPHYCGVIESTPGHSLGSRLQSRYARSRHSARLRSATRGAGPAEVRWGAIQWPGLATLLQDCRDAASLPAIERALAGNALDWLASVGVHPEPGGMWSRSFQS